MATENRSDDSSELDITTYGTGLAVATAMVHGHPVDILRVTYDAKWVARFRDHVLDGKRVPSLPLLPPGTHVHVDGTVLVIGPSPEEAHAGIRLLYEMMTS